MERAGVANDAADESKSRIDALRQKVAWVGGRSETRVLEPRRQRPEKAAEIAHRKCDRERGRQYALAHEHDSQPEVVPALDVEHRQMQHRHGDTGILQKNASKRELDPAEPFDRARR